MSGAEEEWRLRADGECFGDEGVALAGAEYFLARVEDGTGKVGRALELRQIAGNAIGRLQLDAVAPSLGVPNDSIGARITLLQRRLEQPGLDRITPRVTQRAERITNRRRQRIRKRIETELIGDDNRSGQTVARVHRTVLEALLHLEWHVHERHLGASFGGAKAWQPEATLVQSVLDGDGGDLGVDWRDHRHHPLRNVVHRVRIFFLDHRPHIERRGEPIRGAHQLSALRIEPERADDDVPFRLTRSYAQLAKLDRRFVGEANVDRVAALVEVVRL